MPRRKAAVKRQVITDPLYGSDDVSRLINVIMRAGKKSIAEKIVYSALDTLSERLKKEHKEDGNDDSKATKAGSGSKEDSLNQLHKALNNIAPTVEVKSRRVGGATYQVPIEVAADRGMALAMRWVVQAAKKRSEKTMALRLAAELHEAYFGRGSAVKTRDDVHRMAKANQAFAHYRW